jgi:hypothetical protein
LASSTLDAADASMRADFHGERALSREVVPSESPSLEAVGELREESLLVS